MATKKRRSGKRNIKSPRKRKTSSGKISFYRNKTKKEILNQIGKKYADKIAAKKKSIKRKKQKEISSLISDYNKLKK